MLANRYLNKSKSASKH